MTISLVHPSRQRVERAEAAIVEWAANSSGTHRIQHVLSVDTDDPQVDAYRALAARRELTLVCRPNRTMIEAANAGASQAEGDLLVVVSDDFGCPALWDVILATLVSDRPLAAVQVGDGVDSRIMTLPVLTRGYYRQLGYVYFPDYRSLFADDDLTATAARDGVLIDARHVVFPHRHYSAGLSPLDATYARQNDRDAWWQGWRLFQQRMAKGDGGLTGGRLAWLRVTVYGWVWIAGSHLRRPWLTWVPTPLRGLERRWRTAVVRAISDGR